MKRFRGSPEHDMPQTGRTFVPEVAVVRTAVAEGFHHELEMGGIRGPRIAEVYSHDAAQRLPLSMLDSGMK